MRRTAFAPLVLLVAVACNPAPDDDDDLAQRMAREHRGDSPIPSGAAMREPSTPVSGRDVVYGRSADFELSGYLAQPDKLEPAPPALIVIHEWWGLNENIREMTRRLAGEGYLVLAVDLYAGQVAEDPETARSLMQASNRVPGGNDDNLRQAHAYLVEQRGAGRVGTLGWCFGGGWSLNAALMLPDEIDATVIYYGRLETDPDKLRVLSCPILGIFGGLDRAIPSETVRSFESALEGLGKSVEIRIYEDADHAFANPSGTRYDPEAAQDAWRRTLAFLERHLKGAPG